MAVPKPGRSGRDHLYVGYDLETQGGDADPRGTLRAGRDVVEHLSRRPDDTFLSVLPLSHTYECSIGMIYPFSMGAGVVYLDRPPTASALMPALRAVRPSVMLIVPLIIEEDLPPPGAGQIQFQRFLAYALPRGILAPLPPPRRGQETARSSAGVCGSSASGVPNSTGGAESSCWRRKSLMPSATGLPRPRRQLAGAAPSQVRLGSTGPQAPGVQLRLENINPRHPARRGRGADAQRHAQVFQEPRGDEGRSLPTTAGSARAIWANSTRTAGFLYQGPPEEHDRRPRRREHLS